MAAGTDPNINNNVVHNYYGADKGLNLYDSNHRIAISIIGKDNKPKFDPRYVKLIALYYDFIDNVDYVYTEVPFVQCT